VASSEIGSAPHGKIAARADSVLVSLRAVVLLIAALSLAVAGWTALRGGGSVAPSRDAPVTVGSVRVAAGELEAAAARSAGARPGRLAAARRAAADRTIERLWLEGEAAARGLRSAAELGVLRAQVADALVGGRPPDAARMAAAFDAFHERWRARTRCLAAYRDAYEDRCGDGAGAAAGTCRWMGEATVCALRGGGRRAWLVVRDAPSARATRAAAARVPRRLASRLRGARGDAMRFRSRANALAVARAVYVVARTTRARAAAAAKRAAAARAQAAQRARLARARQERAHDPRLTGKALASAQDACRRQLRDSDPYMFGFGMQDVAGQAQGLIAARATLTRRLPASAADAVDRRKLRPLIEAVAAGNHELVRLVAADQTGDLATVATHVARFDARTEPERAISRRLGLGDCLARPAH
jgi:hypothetical protein